MRILIAPDKFKGSLDAREVAASIETGVRDVLPDAIIDLRPVADGGEGTAAVIQEACGGEWVSCAAHDPLGRPIEARYLWLPDSAKAVIEMSDAAGSRRLSAAEPDLFRADTYGVGEMLCDAVNRGAREILLGLGGSATNDGGFGMARALGFRFFAGDRELAAGPADLLNLTRIFPVEPPAVQLIAAADVKNPLLGPRGATRVFGPQKGGTSDQLDLLERALARLAEIVSRDLGCDFREFPGAGAAGGLGFGLMSFGRATTIRPGFDVVAELIGLRTAIEKADVVITGEGRFDAQTLEGKAPAGVASIARHLGKPVHAIVGTVEDSAKTSGLFDSITPLVGDDTSPKEAMANAAVLLRDRAKTLASRLSAAS
jgi:glycerate kinase